MLNTGFRIIHFFVPISKCSLAPPASECSEAGGMLHHTYPRHPQPTASLCANDPDNNHHGDDGDDDEAMLFNINSIRSLYCEIKLQD